MQNGDNGRSVSVTVKDWFEYDGSIRLAVSSNSLRSFEFHRGRYRPYWPQW